MLGGVIASMIIHPAFKYLVAALVLVISGVIAFVLFNAHMYPKAVVKNGEAVYSAENWNRYFWLPWISGTTVEVRGNIVIKGGQLGGVVIRDVAANVRIEARMDDCNIAVPRGTLTIGDAKNSHFAAQQVIVTGRVVSSGIHCVTLTNHGFLAKDVKLGPYLVPAK